MLFCIPRKNCHNVSYIFLEDLSPERLSASGSFSMNFNTIITFNGVITFLQPILKNSILKSLYTACLAASIST
jgi:hypothetical protein